MTLNLDPSHQCVLEHWETISKMIECRYQVQRQLTEFVGAACREVHTGHQGSFAIVDQINSNESYFQLIPSVLLDWKSSGCALLALGIEHISVESLFNIGEPFSAYVYSAYRADKSVNDNSTDELLLSLAAPSGFTRTGNANNRGYLFELVPPIVTPADFCDSEKLRRHLIDPLVTLLNWYEDSKVAEGLRRSGQ